MAHIASEESKRDERIGTIILDRYVIEAVLGRGGMGAVYRAIQRPIERPVAIKLIALGVAGDSRQIVQRFQREAAAMAKLKHPNTVRLIEFGVTADNAMFLAMELLEGIDLGQHLSAHGAISAAVALNIVKESLGSLAEAHALGILHRDIKPANIFLARTHDGQMFAKLMDFGIAQIVDSPDSTRLTVAGSVVGTPAYMSPEQAMGKELDARSDLYSLGVTLFHMLTGRTPFEADSMASQLVAHVTQPAPRLSDVCPERGFSQQLQALLDSLLCKEPERRPPSAKDTLRSIEELLRAESSGQHATPTERWAAVPAPGATSTESTPQPVAIPRTVSATRDGGTGRPSSKRRWTPWLLAAATSFASVGVTYVLTKSNDAPPKQDRPWLVTPALNKPADLPVAVAAPAEPTRVRDEAAQPPGGGVEEPAAPVGEPAPEVRPEERHEVHQQRTAAPPPVLPKPQPKPAAPPTPPAPQYALAPPPPKPAPPPAQPQPRPQPAAAATAFQRLVAMPRADRKQYMMANWPPPYSSVTSVKAAYKSGMIDESFYDDIVWALKMRRKALIQVEKNNYERGLITKQEYKQRIITIDHAYEGR